MNDLYDDAVVEKVRDELAGVTIGGGYGTSIALDEAEELARDALEVAAPLIAAKALRDYAKARYLDFLDNPELPWDAQPEGLARDYARAATTMLARADVIEAGR